MARVRVGSIAKLEHAGVQVLNCLLQYEGVVHMRTAETVVKPCQCAVSKLNRIWGIEILFVKQEASLRRRWQTIGTHRGLRNM